MSDPTQGDRVNVTDVEMQDFPLPQDEVGTSDVEATLSRAGPSTSSTPKKKISMCGVCGDVARSLHFGGRCCDSCKAFFRRAVQNESSPFFKCHKGGVNEIRCEISMKTRKSCQSCRFKKCLSIGMEEQWVMSPAEREALAEQRRSRNEGELKFLSRHTILPAEDPQQGNMDESEDVLNWEDKSEIIALLNKYHETCIEPPYHEPTYPPENQSGGMNSLDIITLFVSIIRRITVFYMNQSEFQNLPHRDKLLLMKSGALEICMLRSAIHYNSYTRYWSSVALADNHKRSTHQTASTSSSSNSSSNNSPFNSLPPPLLQLDDMKKLVSLDTFQLHCKFMGDIQSLCADEATVAILTQIVLFCPDRVYEGFTPLLAADQVNIIQEKYLRLLKKYVNWRYGDTEGRRMYPKFLQKITDLRELTEKHLTSKLNLEDAESKMISDALAALVNEIG